MIHNQKKKIRNRETKMRKMMTFANKNFKTAIIILINKGKHLLNE